MTSAVTEQLSLVRIRSSHLHLQIWICEEGTEAFSQTVNITINKIYVGERLEMENSYL